MNPRRSKQQQAWLGSEEGRLTTLIAQGMLSEALGKRLLLELKQIQNRVVTGSKGKIVKPIPPAF